MNENAKKTLAALGIVVTTGLVYIVNKPSNPFSCRNAVAACDFHLGGGEYQRKEILVKACPTDAGNLEIVPGNGSPIPTDIYACSLSEFRPGVYPRNARFACAWAPKGGDCFILDDLEDGGTSKRQAGDFTIAPGRFVGTECEPRPCTEVAGSPWKP